MAQERLSQCAVLAIDRDLTEIMDVEQVVDTVALSILEFC